MLLAIGGTTTLLVCVFKELVKIKYKIRWEISA
jgi:hypothetical protein